MSRTAAFKIFSLDEPAAGVAAVDEVLRERTGYLGPTPNVAILPVLGSDPGPDEADESWARHHFHRRSQARLMAPRRRSSRAPLRIISGERQASEVRALLLDAGLDIPTNLRAQFSRQLANRRRWTEVSVPSDVDPARVVDFSCRAISVLDTDRVTGDWMVVPSGRAVLFDR